MASETEAIRELRYRVSQLETQVTELSGDFYRRRREGVINWQPIETAPMNGSMVLLGASLTDYVSGGKWIGDSWLWEGACLDVAPTHWAPLNLPEG